MGLQWGVGTGGWGVGVGRGMGPGRQGLATLGVWDARLLCELSPHHTTTSTVQY